MKIIEKDITTVEEGIICQQVNCKSVMGSGLAKSIRNKWADVYDLYIEKCKEQLNDFDLLGKWQSIQVAEKLHVANIFSQYAYNKPNIPFTKHTEYGALNIALAGMRSYFGLCELPIYFPYNYGSDRGGGDFSIVCKIIYANFPDAIICKLP